MFERILYDEYYQRYEPIAVSMPNPTEEQKEKGIIDGPWVIVFDNFLTFEECDRLIELGAIEGYDVSTDVGRENFDGKYASTVNSGRTSTNAWCKTKCYDDVVAKRVSARIENVTGIPEPNAEYLQLLRYEPGQYYNTHHDYIEYQRERQNGVRTLTVFLYLNDVDAGGETEFPILGFKVPPQKGRAVIWPSVLNEDPNAKDGRTEHGVLPVEWGIKYGVNAWIHQKDVKAAIAAGCA
jgi:prolyl 4-hydroxylase